MKIFPHFDEFAVRDLFTTLDEDVIAAAITAAGYFSDSIDYQPLTRSEYELAPEIIDTVSPSGARFVIPLVLPEGMPSGDGRSFAKGALTTRDLPLPLMWQIKTDDGHSGSVIVGRIDTIERLENGLGNARGVFDVGPYGREAERLVRDLFLRGISADLDEFEATSEEEPEIDAKDLAADSKDDKDTPNDAKKQSDIKNRKIVVDKARLMGITLVAKPAFQECRIMIEPEPTLSTGDDFVMDGVYEDLMDDMDNELAALAASGAPVVPPREWFNDPKLSGPTPLTIDDNGRVFGHIAAWNVDHIGLSRGTKPPRSSSKYAYFRTGVLRVDDGSDVAVGQLTLAGGHASMSASAADAVKHYDDTASVFADVTAGEDRFGIWVSGGLRPDLTPNQVRAARASAPSGDWRPIGRKLELVAVCAVNVPGFPTVRTMVAGGQLTALVAAGTAPLLALKEEKELSTLEKRIAALENSDMASLAARKDAAMKRMTSLSINVAPSEKVDPAMVASALLERMNAITASAKPAPARDDSLSLRAAALRDRLNNL